MKTAKFFTVGCKVNQYETQLIREQFLNVGFQEVEECQPAEYYVINTCTVTQRADKDSFSFIHRAKKENPSAKIIVCGCLAELDEDRIKKESPYLIVKNKEKKNLISLLFPNFYPQFSISYFKGHTRAFVKVQEGCNYNCSYCKVRLVRGRSVSRPIEEIKKEVTTLIKNGYREIVLCGVCLGLYGRDLSPPRDLSDLICELEKIEYDFRIRLSSIEAQDIDDKLIDKFVASEKLCSHLHIPFQSGDREILKRMNRPFSPEDYLNLVKKLKEKIPYLSITTDIIVGFPAESEDNFINTLEFLKEVQPLKIHIFSFSPRKGTQISLDKSIIYPVIRKRIKILEELNQELSFNFRRKFLGEKLRVLIEKKPDFNSGLYQGYTDNYIRVLLDTKKHSSEFKYVIIQKVEKEFTFGKLL